MHGRNKLNTVCKDKHIKIEINLDVKRMKNITGTWEICKGQINVSTITKKRGEVEMFR